MTLGAIANKSEGVVLEVVLELSQGPVTALVDDLLVASEFQSLQTTDSLKTTEKKRAQANFVAAERLGSPRKHRPRQSPSGGPQQRQSAPARSRPRSVRAWRRPGTPRGEHGGRQRGGLGRSERRRRPFLLVEVENENVRTRLFLELGESPLGRHSDAEIRPLPISWLPPSNTRPR